jgi:UDP:flavonoid glycosyltransferase YjiC (YdhE family)
VQYQREICVKITVVTQDTRGGVQPYAALARGLVEAGHDVQAVAPAEYVWLFERVGIACLPLAGMGAEESRDVALQAQGERHGGLRSAARAIVQRVPEWASLVRRFAEGSDLLTGGVGGSIIGEPVASAMGVPWVPAHLQPVGAVNADYPGVLMTGIPRAAGAVGNLLGQLLTEAAIRVPFQAAQAAARRTLGGSRRVVPRHRGTVYGISPSVIQLRRSDRENRLVAGYWFDRSDSDVLPPEVEDFITNGGDQPVVSIGFGSMVTAEPSGLRNLLVDAARAAGTRVVLIAGAGAVSAHVRQDEPHVLTIASVPHHALFHRMDANVHHGGAGTTANAFAAGVPSVVVPFGADQPFWARRATDLGVSPPPTPIARLTRDRLTESLRVVLDAPGLRSRSAELGRRIRSEDGTRMAAQWYSSLEA